MTRAQLNYRYAGARGDLAALLAPYVVTLSTLAPAPVVTSPAAWPAYDGRDSSNWVEGDW